jgi:GT2 family glycosyltransferase
LQVTEEFIQSCLQIDYTNYEIIIVDNGSLEESLEMILDKYPDHVKIIFSDTNLGFAGGNNLGIKEAVGEFLLFLNNDTEVKSDILSTMVRHFEKHPHCGMLSPKLKYFNTNRIQYAGSFALNPLTGRSKRIGLQEEDAGQYDISYQTDIIHGAAMMVSKRCLDLIGKMPEFYFLYYEEIDWCLTAKRKGFEIWFTGLTEVYHKESMSVGKVSPIKTFYMSRNRVLYMRRNYSGLTKTIWLFYFFLLTLPKNFLTLLLNRNTTDLQFYLKGVRKGFAFKLF